VDDSVLDRGDIDIQCVVSCASASETVMLSSNRILALSRTITVNKPLTVTGFHEGKTTNKGVYPAAEKTIVINCPVAPDQGVFDIRYNDLLFDLLIVHILFYVGVVE